MSEPHECPRLMEVHRLWEGDLDAASVGDVRRHLAQCDLCQAEVESWDRLSGLLARGDLARPVAPERRQRMKAALLEQCGASFEEASDPSGRRSAPVFWPWRWGMPFRVGLALAPLALAALFWVASGRYLSTDRTPSPSQIVSAPGQDNLPPAGPHPRPLSQGLEEGGQEPATLPGTPLPVLGRGAGGEGRSATRALNNAGPPVPPRLVISRRAEKPSRRPRRIRREGRMRATPRERRQSPAPSQLIAAVPKVEQAGLAPAADVAAPKPIERIVIQVDEPPVRPVETVTRITVIASGDLKAPDATLTVVKTEREETLP